MEEPNTNRPVRREQVHDDRIQITPVKTFFSDVVHLCSFFQLFTANVYFDVISTSNRKVFKSTIPGTFALPPFFFNVVIVYRTMSPHSPVVWFTLTFLKLCSAEP